jgi:alkanesulfonate monooxygenase SsuD/methylene tetrahydromethanopterin reductase-like flavin-dependent oxidoreductase (luciferase family)
MKRSVALAVSSFDALIDAALHIEALNLDRVWATELRSRDVFIRALHIAAHTAHIEVGTGIAYAFTRHPMAMAAAAVEGQDACGGRLTVGIGAGTPHTRGEFGLDFDHPAPRLAEYVAVMRAALEADGDLEFHGRFYDVSMPGFAFAQPRSVRESVRIYGAALNPIALHTLSRVCDGVALHPFGHLTHYLDSVVLPTLAKASAEVHRPPPAVAAWMIACALDDAEEARALAKAQIALYSAQPGFAPFLDQTPWAAAAGRIRSEVRLAAGHQQWRAIGSKLVPDDMLDGLAAAGTPADVASAVTAKEKQLNGFGVAEIALQIPGVGIPAEHAPSLLKGLAAALGR